MAHANRDEGLHIELDCLLDTRLGTVKKISDEAARRLVSSTQYFQRDEDVFDGVPLLRYRRLWQERDVDTLKGSVLTNLIKMHVSNVVKQLTQQALTQPEHDAVVIDVNIYPYQLSEPERVELVRVVTYQVLHGGVALSEAESERITVKLIDMKPALLTPSYCKERYGAMWMYDVGPWLEAHTEAFNTVRLPEVLIYVPKLYQGKRPTDQDIAEIRQILQGNTSDPFSLTEMQLSPIAGVRMLDVSDFSSSIKLSSDPATA